MHGRRRSSIPVPAVLSAVATAAGGEAAPPSPDGDSAALTSAEHTRLFEDVSAVMGAEAVAELK